MQVKRNEPCWCNSGKKYKHCHFLFDQKLAALAATNKIIPPHAIIKNDADIEGIRKSGEINTGVLDYVAENIHEGMSTEEIDQLVFKYTSEHNAICAPFNYHGFPKHVCTSINEEVCHGIPSEKIILKDGDIVNVDVSTIYNGYFSDASRMFMIGNVSETARQLVEDTKKCLNIGIEAVKPWGNVGDIGAAIQEYAHSMGYSVVVDFMGHGVGKLFHEDPNIPHYGTKGNGMILAPGMVFTIEPMINMGDYHTYVDAENGWTAYTKDGSLSAQWEHTIYVHEDGIEILTH